MVPRAAFHAAGIKRQLLKMRMKYMRSLFNDAPGEMAIMLNYIPSISNKFDNMDPKSEDWITYCDFSLF